MTRFFHHLFTLILSACLLHADTDPHQIDDPLMAEASALTSGFAETAAAPTIAPAATQGSWGPIISWTPHIPVTAATLPDGRLLTFASNQRTTFPSGPEFTYSAVWNPKTGVFTEANNSRHDMFCGGTAMLPDGRVVINGGRATTVLASIFDFRTTSWSALQNMNDPRWYNPSVTLPDGTVFTVSGSGGSNTAELWNANTGWRRLTGIDWSQVTSQPGYINIWHPFIMVAPNGKLFHFGPTDKMNWVTTKDSGTFTPTSLTIPGTHYPKEGAWAMYNEGKILIAGGGATPTNNPSDTTTGISTNVAFTIDLNGTTPTVTPTASMQYARQFANSVILPNGEILVIGGNTSGLKFNDTGSILTPEIWNPGTGTWRSLANMSVPRNYHSAALLLPDGRVWSGGGGLGGADHRDAQLFTPPNLFTSDGSLAPRPSVTNAPATIGLGTTFTVNATPGMSRFTFIRMSAQTHSVNTDLRFLELPFTETSAGTYQLTGSLNPNVMMPGYWMLFALDSSGVYSEARILKVTTDSDVNLTSPGDQLSIQGQQVQLQVAASAPAGTTLNYSATGLPPGLTLNPTTGKIEGTLTGQADTYWTTVYVQPNNGGSVSTSFNWTVLLPNLGNGRILREWWLNLSGATLSNLTTSTLYPANPTGRDILNSFETPTNWADDLGQRIRGYLHPAVSGNYRFYIAADDEARLLLSSNDSPSNTTTIATVPSWSNSREWTKSTQQASVLISLEAGKRYYIEALMKEGGGGDNLAVGWIPPGKSTIEVIPGQNLSPYDPASSPIAAWRFDEPDWNGTANEAKEYIRRITGLDGKAVGNAFTSLSTPALEGNPGTGRSALLQGGYVQIPAQANLHSNDFTLAAWVRPESLTSSNLRAIATARDTSTTTIRGYGLYLSTDGKWTFSTGGSSWTSLTGPVMNPGQWSHLAVTFRTTSISGNVRTGTRRIFINGQQVAEDTATYTPPSTSPLLIGAAAVSNGITHLFNGSVDELRTYDTPLGPLDIQEIQALRHRFNHIPTLPHPGNPVSAVNSVVSRAFIATDDDGDPLTWQANGLPDGLTLSSSTGIISGIPTSPGDSLVTLRVTDPDGERATQTFLWSIVDNLTVTPAGQAPRPSGTTIEFQASSQGGSNPRFKWNFGDGSPDTSFQTQASTTHTFPGPGRYLVTVTAQDDLGNLVTRSYYQAIHAPLSSTAPTSSSPIYYENRSAGNPRIWVVNPDHNSITVIDATTRSRIQEIPTGTSPQHCAQAPDGRIWVSNSRDDSVAIIHPDTLNVVARLTFPHGSRPQGIIFPANGTTAWLTLEGTGQLLKLHPLTGATLTQTPLAPHIRGLCANADGSRIYISRFITPRLPGEETATVNPTGKGGEILVVQSTTSTLERTIFLAHSNQPDTEISARGIPNYLAAPVITPDALSLWVPSKQDNLKRGVLRDGLPLTHDRSIRAIASRVNLSQQTEDLASRVDFDNAGVPSAVVHDPWGIYAFVALEASRSVAVMDLWNHKEILRFDTGRAPQGLTLSPNGRTLFVHNFMDRSVSVHNVSSIIDGATNPPPSATVIPTTATETLSSQILTGKQLFYDARDTRLSFQEYISCAACHHDGEEDGRVWDFTGFGEGLRNTITLRGHGGTRQGRLHWSGNFDEVQDFENQIRNFALGQGLISQGTPHPPLGSPNAGRSADLDALAAYVTSLTRHDTSPYREPSGALTPAATRGERLFRTLDCASCHGGTEFTNSQADQLIDIGTLKPSSGKRLGGPLTGIDIPTLRGVWNTAPYLHDGSAATLEQAIASHQGIQLQASDQADLVAYLNSLDDQPATAPLSPLHFEGWSALTPSASGTFDGNHDGDLYPDLLEFALGGQPDSGASPSSTAFQLEETSNSINGLIRRPVNLRGLTYQLLTSPDLVTWTAAASPTITSESSFEQLRFSALHLQPGLSLQSGFAKLRVTDSSGNSAETLPLGWQTALIDHTSRTIGIPFRKVPIFSSSVISHQSGTLTVHGNPPTQGSFQGFIEVISGPATGHRFQIGSISGSTLTLQASPQDSTPTPPDLTNSRIVLCAHHTLGEVFDKQRFKGSTNPSAADQLQFYVNNGNTGQFQLYYLLDARPANPTHQWRAFLPGSGDQSGRIIAPGEGVLLKRPANPSPLQLRISGQVRANDFLIPLQPGIQLLSSPFPLPLSPRSFGLLHSNSNYTATTNPNTADQFQLYDSSTFRIFYLLDHPTQVDQWRETVSGSPNYNDSPLFLPTQAIFLKRNRSFSSYVIPRTW